MTKLCNDESNLAEKFHNFGIFRWMVGVFIMGFEML
jgi:hypothetical protein